MATKQSEVPFKKEPQKEESKECLEEKSKEEEEEVQLQSNILENDDVTNEYNCSVFYYHFEKEE